MVKIQAIRKEVKELHIRSLSRNIKNKVLFATLLTPGEPGPLPGLVAAPKKFILINQ